MFFNKPKKIVYLMIVAATAKNCLNVNLFSLDLTKTAQLFCAKNQSGSIFFKLQMREKFSNYSE